jgi:hypothetical protein
MAITQVAPVAFTERNGVKEIRVAQIVMPKVPRNQRQTLALNTLPFPAGHPAKLELAVT